MSVGNVPERVTMTTLRSQSPSTVTLKKLIKNQWKTIGYIFNTSKVACQLNRRAPCRTPQAEYLKTSLYLLTTLSKILKNNCVKTIYNICKVIISGYTIFVTKQQSNYQLFQAVCVIIAFLSWLLMRYTGMNVQVAVEASTTSSTQNQGSISILY